MKRFKSIVVVVSPFEASEATLERALQLARANNARVTIVSVQRELERNLPNLQKAIQRQQEERLRLLAGKVASKGDSIECKGLIGIPFIEIIREVLSAKHDLLMKPAEGRGGLSRRLFGSTDLHLLRKCPCPVWIMKASRRKKYSRLLAAVDPDPGIKASAELNGLILDLATSIASQEKSELHIVHAWSVPHERLIRSGRARMSPEEIRKITREFKKAHKQWLDELLAQHDFTGIRMRRHLAKGDPADVIASVAGKTRTELVVMGTVARTGVPGFFIGNTAEKVLTVIDCSVLAVKPKAFKTPVSPSGGS